VWLPDWPDRPDRRAGLLPGPAYPAGWLCRASEACPVVRITKTSEAVCAQDAVSEYCRRPGGASVAPITERDCPGRPASAELARNTDSALTAAGVRPVGSLAGSSACCRRIDRIRGVHVAGHNAKWGIGAIPKPDLVSGISFNSIEPAPATVAYKPARPSCARSQTCRGLASFRPTSR
jgi:hypothetical protein